MSVYNLKTGELEKLREQNAELKRVLMEAFDQAIEHKAIAATFRKESGVVSRRLRVLKRQLEQADHKVAALQLQLQVKRRRR